MKVIDFEPQFWFLLQHDNSYFLDVNCSYSAFGYSRFIELNDLELNGYREKGKLYLIELGNDIQYYGLDKKYLERHMDGELSKLAYSAIMEFNKINKH